MAKQVVVFTMNEQRYCVDIQYVNEITVLNEMTFVPKSTPFIEGIMNLRGSVLPLIQLSKVFGIRRQDEKKHGQILILSYEEKQFGIIVDSAQDVKTYDDEWIEDGQNFLGQQEKIVEAIVKDREELIQVISVKELLEKCKDALE